MFKLRFNLSFLGNRSFQIPKFNKSKPLAENLYKFSVVGLQIYLGLVLFILPFSIYFLKNESVETSVFYFFVLASVIAIGFFVISIALGGTKRFIDPVGFAIVLIFALLTTTSAISTNPPTIANTFGLSGIRGISGVALMAFIAFYYLLNSALTDFRIVKKYVLLFVSGALLLSYYLLIDSKIDGSTTVFILASMPVLFGLTLYSKRFKLVFALLTVYVFGLQYWNDLFPSATMALLVFVSFFPTLILLIAFATKYKKFFSKKVSNLTKLDSAGRIFGNFTDFFYIIMPVIFLGIFIYLAVEKVQFEDLISTSWEAFKNSWESISAETVNSTNQIRNIAFGLGSDYLSMKDSLISNVIRVQGLVGLGAYVLIWVYSYYISVKTFLLNVKFSNYYKLLLPFNLYLLAIPLVGLFIYPGVGLLVMFWISLGFVTASKRIVETKNKLVYTDKEWALKKMVLFKRDLGKKSNGTRLFLSFVCLILTTLPLYLVYTTIGEV